MRLRKPYKKCRFCKNEVPIQLFLYCGFFVDSKKRMFRLYRCAMCKSTIYLEKVTDNEKINGNIDDQLYNGSKTIYGYCYNGL